MGAQIPVITEKPLPPCGWKEFQIDAFTAHSGAKMTHDWAVDQLANLFHTTHKVKTQQVIGIRGRQSGDIELGGRGSNSDPNLNGHLHYPNDIDRSLNETTTDKIRKYRVDYNNNPPD